jgi:methionyl-tRNA formyltransferase
VPEFRGSPPVLWEIYEGEPTVGWTVHLIDRHVDTGGIVAEGEVPFVVADTLEETYYRTRLAVFEASAQGLVDVLGKVAAEGLHPREQRGKDVPARTTPGWGQWRRVQQRFGEMKAARRKG